MFPGGHAVARNTVIHFNAPQNLCALQIQCNKEPCPVNALRQLTTSGNPYMYGTEYCDITLAGPHFVLLQSHRKTLLFCHNVRLWGR